MKKLRILHAPAIVTNQQWIISRAQRKLGHISDFVVFNADKKELLVKNCDLNFHFDRKDISFRPQKAVKTLKFLVKFLFFFIQSLFKYDVFHFHSESFLGSRSSLDLAILKFLGKKIVFQYWGCDIRLKTISTLSEEFSTCDSCIRVCQNSRKLRDNLMYLKYADFRVYGGADVIRMVPDAIFIPIAIDLDHWKPVNKIPQEYLLPRFDGIRILQAYANAKTRGDQKGGRFLSEAIDRLKENGYKIDYIFLEDMPYELMRYYYQQADIVFEQLLSGWHGNVAVEAMAMAKPVICYLNQDALRFLPNDHPIVNANPKNICEKLKMLIDNQELRAQIGKRSREYVQQRHDAVRLAKQYLDLYSVNWKYWG